MEEPIIKITRLETQMQTITADVKGLRKEMKTGLKEISQKIDGLDCLYVRRDLYEQEKEDMLEDISSNTKDKRWVVQIIIQIVLTAIVAGIVKIA